MAQKQEGLYLGEFVYTDKKTNKKRYIERCLVWSDRNLNALTEPQIATIFADSPFNENIKLFSNVEVDFDFVKDFKTGMYKPKYLGITLKIKKEV